MRAGRIPGIHGKSVMYLDAYEVYELLDKWNHRGPPITESVRDLFERNPSAARQEFLYGQTLLHKCMDCYGNRDELVSVFLEAYPEALMKADDNGFLPLHRVLISANWDPQLKLVQLLINRAPESILCSPPSGALPLHLACRRKSESIVKYLVDCFPDAVQYRDSDGNFPLDHALDAVDPNDRIVELLVKEYPVLLSFLDDKGRLPLHRTLRRQRNRYDKIVDILIEYCPGSLRFQDAQGQTPLLQACNDNNSLSQIYSLVRNWPEQVTTQARLTLEHNVFNGEMLPSALCSKSTSIHRVQKWVELHPDVVNTPDLQGRLPIHYAAISSSLEIVQFLLEESNSSVSVPDGFGRLPLHYAAVACSGQSEVTNLLLEAYPEGLLHSDKDMRLPWHYAECARQDGVYDSMYELFPDVEIDLDLVPEEVRWDVIQIAALDDY